MQVRGLSTPRAGCLAFAPYLVRLAGASHSALAEVAGGGQQYPAFSSETVGKEYIREGAFDAPPLMYSPLYRFSLPVYIIRFRCKCAKL